MLAVAVSLVKASILGSPASEPKRMKSVFVKSTLITPSSNVNSLLANAVVLALATVFCLEYVLRAATIKYNF